MEPPRPVLITLVHGTFAPGAAWTRDDSALCKALRERLPGASIGAFPWSGRNSNKARLDAALELAQWTETRITECEREHGGPIDHYVIAHSHGGNVALYACRSRHFADHLTKLVCLSTPFLSARVRYQSRMILITLVVGFLYGGGIGGVSRRSVVGSRNRCLRGVLRRSCVDENGARSIRGARRSSRRGTVA